VVRGYSAVGGVPAPAGFFRRGRLRFFFSPASPPVTAVWAVAVLGAAAASFRGGVDRELPLVTFPLPRPPLSPAAGLGSRGFAFTRT